MKWHIAGARVLPVLFLLAGGSIALSQPVATQQTSGSYTAGTLLEATNSFSYSGELWSLLWRPQLPAGWTIASVSGTGNPELQSGEIVWTGILPASPIQMAHTVQVPGNASGVHQLRGEVEYQLAGMVNPATLYASPDPLTVSEPLVLQFSATPTNGQVPLTVVFTNLSTHATEYAWNFGDGNTSTNVHPLNTYSNAGSYSVTLTAIGTGITNTLTRTNYIVVINPALLVVTPTGLDFGLVATGATTQASLVISNAGMATLAGAASVGAGPFAILAGTPFSLEAAGATNLTVRFNPVTVGSFSNLVVITSTGGNATHPVTGRAASAPRIVVLPGVGTDFVFAFDTVPGLTYFVQFKDPLEDPNWQTAQSVPGDGTRKTVTHDVATPSHRFYRLWVQ